MHNDDHISIDWSFNVFVFYVNCKTQDVGSYEKKSSQKIQLMNSKLYMSEHGMVLFKVRISFVRGNIVRYFNRIEIKAVFEELAVSYCGFASSKYSF